MLKGKKVIIFDMDGTLIDSIGIWNEIDRELIKTISKENIGNIDIGKQRDEKLKEYSKSEDAYLEYCGFLKEKYHSKISKEEIKKIRYEIADNYLRTIIDYKPNVEKVLKYLKQKGFILVIASTTNDHTIDIYNNNNKNIINKANIGEIFSLIYSKGSVKELKPNPEIHYKILKELNVDKEECLIIEDSLIGVEAANNANIEVAIIYDRYSDCNRKEINKLSQYQFKDYNEMLKYIKNEMGE
ncbi:MAG: HAD family phosphatase [Clostridia bacterium]|nr:HAD family phosphatase [Clostridia bacterium]